MNAIYVCFVSKITGKRSAIIGPYSSVENNSNLLDVMGNGGGGTVAYFKDEHWIFSEKKYDTLLIVSKSDHPSILKFEQE